MSAIVGDAIAALDIWLCYFKHMNSHRPHITDFDVAIQYPPSRVSNSSCRNSFRTGPGWLSERVFGVRF